jgi:hypothetical protein
MSFLTIFSAPKPFTNPHINVIQHNAIQSWTRLADTSVVLVGDEAGIGEAAQEFGAKHVPEVARDEKGVPTVRSVMAQGHALSDSPVLCYANADMILMSDLLRAAHQVTAQVRDFLMVGQRWDLNIPEPLDFSAGWEERLRAEVARRGKFYNPWGIDYFVFPRHLYTEVPNFTIGRPAWDNWMVYHALSTWKLALDATRSVLVVHQTHDYYHLPGNRPPYGSEVAKSNLAKAGGRKNVRHIMDANKELIDGKICPPRSRFVRLLRLLERSLLTEEEAGWRWRLAIVLSNWQRPLATRPRR